MVWSLPAFSGVPTGTSAVLDLTADLAPLLVGLWVLLGLCVLGLTVVTAIHDTWWEPRKARKAADRPDSLSKAA